MKVDPTLARTYGDALFQAVKGTGTLKAFYDQAEAFRQALKDAVEFVQFLEAPNVPNDRKEELVRRSMGGRFDPLLQNFVLLLIRRGRINILRDALRQFQIIAERANGYYRATVTSARPLDDAQKQAIQSTMERRLGHQLYMRYEINERLIGGIQFKCDDLLVDNTLRTRLNNIHEKWMSARVI